MNDDLLASRIIRQYEIIGSSVRVLSPNTPFPLEESSIILLKPELSGESPRRYDMCLSAFTALCSACLKLNARQVFKCKALVYCVQPETHMW